MAHAIKALLIHYDAAFQRKHGAPYPISRAKDTALAKQLLTLYTLEQLCGWADRFFTMADPFIEKSGYSFGTFRGCLGKVIAAERRVAPRMQPDARVAAIHERKAEENKQVVKDLADEYFRTHPWAKR